MAGTAFLCPPAQTGLAAVSMRRPLLLKNGAKCAAVFCISAARVKISSSYPPRAAHLLRRKMGAPFYRRCSALSPSSRPFSKARTSSSVEVSQKLTRSAPSMRAAGSRIAVSV